MNDIVVFSFGRLQPVTIGHQRLIETVIEKATELGADHVIFLSQTRKHTTDPLDWSFKLRVCKYAFKNANISTDATVKNPFIALEQLKERYKKIILVAGSDQVDEYILRFTPYARKWGVEFEVVSSGTRSNDAEGVAGISATKMRQYAIENNKVKFFEGLPTTVSSKVKALIYANTRKGLKRP